MWSPKEEITTRKRSNLRTPRLQVNSCNLDTKKLVYHVTTVRPIVRNWLRSHIFEGE